MVFGRGVEIFVKLDIFEYYLKHILIFKVTKNLLLFEEIKVLRSSFQYKSLIMCNCEDFKIFYDFQNPQNRITYSAEYYQINFIPNCF